MSRNQLDFHEEFSEVEERTKEVFFSVLENKLRKYEGQFVILDERGRFYSEIACLCGTSHVTVFLAEETAKSAIEAMLECEYYKNFKNSKVHQVNNEFFKWYEQTYYSSNT